MRSARGLQHTLLVDAVGPCAIAALILVITLTLAHWNSLASRFDLTCALDSQRLTSQLIGVAQADRSARLQTLLQGKTIQRVLRLELRHQGGSWIGAGMPADALNPDLVQAVTTAANHGVDGTFDLRLYVDKRPLRTQLRWTLLFGVALGLGVLLLAALSQWLVHLHVVRPWRRAADTLDAINQDQPPMPLAVGTDRDSQRLHRAIESLATQVDQLRQNATALRNTSSVEALARLQQLQSLALGKTRFISSVGHHFRQPLQALHLFIASLLADASAPQRSALEQMRGCIDAMTRLLGGLVDISRLDAGVQARQVQSFSVESLFASERVASHALAARSDVAIHWHHGNLQLTTDREMLGRILHELLINALTHAPRSRILIAARRRGQSVRIEVRDGGPGISTLNQRRIFDDFVQLPSATTATPGGYGLGLAIAARMAKALDSHIDLRSDPGHGSTFSLTLAPLLADPGAGQSPAP